MRAFLIALGGIRVGSIRPLELATDGLLEVVDKPDLPGGFGYWAVPCLPHPNIKPKKDCVIQLETGCSLTAKTASPKVRISSSFEIVGCQEENELEVYLMAQAAFKMLFEDDPDPKDLRIRALEKDAQELRGQNIRLRDQLSREKRLKK